MNAQVVHPAFLHLFQCRGKPLDTSASYHGYRTLSPDPPTSRSSCVRRAPLHVDLCHAAVTSCFPPRLLRRQEVGFLPGTALSQRS